MAAHARKKPRKGLRVWIGLAATAGSLLGGIFFFGAPANAATADDPTSTSAPAAPAAPDSQASAPAAGSTSTDQQQAQQGTDTQSTDQGSQASTPSETPAAPAAPTPAPAAPAPAAAPAAPVASAPDTTSAQPNAPPAGAQAPAKLSTQPLQVQTPPEKAVVDFQIARTPASYCVGERVSIVTPTPAINEHGELALPGLIITESKVNGQDVSLAQFLEQAVGKVGAPNSYSIAVKADAQSTLPSNLESIGYSSGDVPLDPPTNPNDPTCNPQGGTVDNPNWMYTFDPATGTTVVTVTGGHSGQKLTKPLSVRPAAWTYDLPTLNIAPSWGQTLVGPQDANDVLIDAIGTYTIKPPQVPNCRQYDIYASFDGFGALALPEHLNGPNNPHEPSFLHQVLPGKGPNPTYSFTSTEGCNTTPPPPTVVTPAQPTVHDWCGVEHDGATPPPDTDQIAYSTAGGHLSARLKLPNTVWAKDLGANWALGEDGNIHYTLITTPTPCLSKMGQDFKRTFDCVSATETTTPWTIARIWDDKTQSDVWGPKVYGTPVVKTGLPLTDTEKATCPITVVTHLNPPGNNTVQEVAAPLPSVDRLASTGSDAFGALWLALFLGVPGIALMVSRRFHRKAAASK